MKTFEKLTLLTGLTIAAASFTCFAERAGAQFTLTGTTAELVARGINAGFETPAVAVGDTEAFASGLGAGWTFNLVGGVSSNQGRQNPAIGFYGQVNPLPAPFEGNQIGFFNLDTFSQGEAVSNPIGRLRSGQTYTLNVAVGARNNDGWSDVAYRVGLRASDGTDLGTFATTTLNPSSTIPTNISELTYTLNSGSVPSYIGDEVSIVIGGYNTGMNEGVITNQFTQANFDNVRLTGTFDNPFTPSSASLTINRQTGNISLSNTSGANLNVQGYSLTSAAGSLNQSGWNLIGGSFTKLTAAGSVSDLSEMDFQGSGTVLTTTTARNLGNVWLRTPFEDVQGQLLLSDGSSVAVNVQYAGTAIPSGDLNGDGVISTADWTLFKAGQGTNFTGLSLAQSYLKGDMNGDRRHDLFDFVAFRAAFEGANGAGAFAMMLANVPEPGTGLLLVLGGALAVSGVRRHGRQRAFFRHRPCRKVTALLAGNVACLFAAGQVSAQSVVSHWSFDSSTLTVSGGNITAVAEQTGNHNATPGTGGTGGATGDAFVSAAFPAATSSIAGQFGEALQFNGDNFLLFNNLTELMEASGAPSYSVSMWINAAPAVTITSAHPFATLASWGNEPASAGPTRFTYAFGPAGPTAMRGQSRRNEPTSGGGGTNGDDIFARNATTTAINNGVWHMLTWTFDTSTGVLTSYFDGAQVDTFTSTDPSFAMADSSSAVGGLGIKGDNGVFLPQGVALDEVWVFRDVLTSDQIDSLFSSNALVPITISLRVDPTSGQAQLRNDTAEPLSFNSYRIASASGSLSPSGWDPIATGTPIPGFPQGNGTGNGWEAPGGGGSPTGDYNSDGKVDAADYVLWRKNNINGPQGYADWRANFGATGGGIGGNNTELVEWYLTGDSTLAPGASISLGQAFTPGGTQDLLFQFGSGASVRTGLIEYGTIGSGAASAVPESSTSSMLALALGMLAIVSVRPRQIASRSALVRIAACLLVASVTASSAMATITLDRLYRFGENGTVPQAQENGSAGAPVGSGHTLTGATPTTLDHVGPSGSFQTLSAHAIGGGALGGTLPVYQSVSSPLFSSSLGILFDGVDDYLNGFSLGFPPISRGTINGGGTGTLNYNGVYGRGIQFWAFPHSGATAEQHVVSDTTEHGVRITSGGNWMLRHAGTNVNSNVPVAFNQWSHVMAAIPEISNPYRGVLYVNGVAIAAQSENYLTSTTVQDQALIVGANTDASGTNVGTSNFYRGVLDELEMFIWGTGYDHVTNTFTDFGTFNFATDNRYAADFLTGVAGDINNSGALTQADVNAFVAGWLNEKRVNGVRVGDLTTFAMGDLNFDGITDIADARLMRQALTGSGAGAGFDLTGFAAVTGVPEPSSLALLGMLTALMCYLRRRRGGFER